MKAFVLMSAALYGALAILFGAFGAHALKKIFSESLQKSFETAVKYQMYHALALLVIGFELSFDATIEKVIAWLFILGTFLFSFSIYGLCISSAKDKKLRFLGPITPIGGLLLTIGWIVLGIHFMQIFS